MRKHLTSIKFSYFITILLGLSSPFILIAQIKDAYITIHLRGVYESKISLATISGGKKNESIIEVQGIKNGGSASLNISKELLPGEFVLRFDYKEKKESTSSLSEKYIFIGNQNLELWVSPKYCDNSDSAWFQKGEKENTTFALFSKENIRQKEKLGLLQQFLMNYDDTKSKFYLQGIEEYENRRQVYNQWLDKCSKSDKSLFVSSLYRFNFLPQIPWEGSETDRMVSIINNYFDGIDFNDSVITKTSQLTEWMNNYVNLQAQKAVTIALRDSIIPAAARIAIEKAKLGNPLVYGWMVDYFYNGFESNNIPAGIKVLEYYLDDPKCLTSKRMEINRRLKGIKTLVEGIIAPNIILKDSDSKMFELNKYRTSAEYILLIFWSADCSHCVETVNAIFPWLQKPENIKKISVVALSLDETESEIKKWEQKKEELKTWIHLRADGGVNSKEAMDYYVLATPVIILLDAKTKKIIALPNTLSELKKFIP